MGTTKQLNFDAETNRIADICKALGHPTRIQILSIIWKENNKTCGEIGNIIPLAQSTISKHLSELKKAELLTIKNEGKKTIYSIDIDKIQQLKKFLSSYLSDTTIFKATEPIKQKKEKEGNKYLKKHNYQFPNKKTE